MAKDTDPNDPRALAARVAALPRPLLVALDVDGTLAPIVDDPDAAGIPDATAAALRTLAARDGVHVALVTGRDAPSLARLAELEGIYRGVEHGRRLLAPDEAYRPPEYTEVERRRLARYEAWALEVAVPQGARIEHKDGAVAVHVRELGQRDPDLAARLLQAARQAARDAGLHPRAGRAVVEGEVTRGDKGEALARIHRALDARGVVYAGDDLTDGPAIRKAVELGGVGLFVCSPERPQAPDGATAGVDGTAAVRAFLDALVAATG